MNSLRINKNRTPDLAYMSHLPLGMQGRRPEIKSERQSLDPHYNTFTKTQFAKRPSVDYPGSQLDSKQYSHYNTLTNTQFSKRPSVDYPGSQLDSKPSYSQPILTQSQSSQQFSGRPPVEYPGSQLDSQQSYSQAVLTQSQNSQQFSHNSGDDFRLASSNAWRYGSRASDLIDKRPRSPTHRARASQLPQNNSKDGSNSVLASQHSTAQTLLQQISNRPGAIGKNMLRDGMEQRLDAIQNCLNGIIGRLDELQKNLVNVEATRESDTSRIKSTLEQKFQILVNTIDKWKKGEAMVSEELKEIPTSFVEQITELKDQYLQSLRRELQVILNWRPQGVQDNPEQDLDRVKTKSATVRATTNVKTLSNNEPKSTSSQIKMSDFKEDGDLPRGSPAKKVNRTYALSNQHESEGYGFSHQARGSASDSAHRQLPVDEGWRSTRLRKTEADMPEQLTRSSWMASGNNDTATNVTVGPRADSHIENIRREVTPEFTFDRGEPVKEGVTVEDEDGWLFPSQYRHYCRRTIGDHPGRRQKDSDDCFDAPADDGNRQIDHKMRQTTTRTRVQRRASRYHDLE